MARRNDRSLEDQCEKITSRFDKHYARRLAKHCEGTGMKPAQLVRFAAMVFLDFGTLDLVTKIQKVEDHLVLLRKDFQEAVYSEEE
ncbi:hypothetical protein [Aeoliella sp.]|uniref:hypothetical protein n=1 Tax=Aeoliella sp. TaxID=2795800 RepID=UPI003CCBEF4F